jgi:hypothetical protein
LVTFETTLACLFAALLVGLAGYFAWRQRLVLRTLRGDLRMPSDQRRYLLKQSGRRLFGSLLMLLLAGMLVGSLFLDYSATLSTGPDRPAEEIEAAKQAARFLGLYWMVLLLVLLVIMALAVIDLWATARFGVQQQKRLVQEHQLALEADLARLRQRRSELN